MENSTALIALIAALMGNVFTIVMASISVRYGARADFVKGIQARVEKLEAALERCEAERKRLERQNADLHTENYNLTRGIQK